MVHFSPEQSHWVLQWVNHLSMSRPLCSSFSVVKQLELLSEYFARYCRNWLSLTEWNTYSWQPKMVYCKLDILVKMVNCKLTTIANKRVYCRPVFAMRCLSLGGIEGVWGGYIRQNSSLMHSLMTCHAHVW